MTFTEKEKRAQLTLTILKKLYPAPKMALIYHTPYELLFAVMLSAQTTDAQVNKVTATLFKKYRTLQEYACVNLDEFENDISNIGLYKSKAKNILATAKILQKEFDGTLPKTMEEMITLPGVGRKTANVVLGAHYGIAYGIAVDTHVTRLAKKFGLTTSKDPKRIERDLMEILPKKEWFYFTVRMIDYGRDFSPARAVNNTDDPISLALAKKGLLPT